MSHSNPQPDLRADSGKQQSRQRKNVVFSIVCLLVAMIASACLAVLLGMIFYDGFDSLSWQLLTGRHHNNDPANSGMWPSIVGSFLIVAICALSAMPVGIGTAILLEEYRPANKVLAWLHGLIQLNINNLAGVPSIVYGILGLTAFVYMFGIFGAVQANKPPQLEFGARRFYQIRTLGKEYIWIPVTDKYQSTYKIEEPIDARYSDGEPVTINVIERGVDPVPGDEETRWRTVYRGSVATMFDDHPWYYLRLPFYKSVLSAGLTLSLVILPIVIIASQEAIRAVPGSLREAALGMGCTRWQMVRTAVLPSALPGILTGAILATGRAVGEAAPLLAIMGGVISQRTGPSNLMEDVTAMPILIYKWAGEPNDGFQDLSAAAIIVLLAFLLLINSVAIFTRYRLEKKYA